MRVLNLEGIMLSVFEQTDWAPSQSDVAKNRVKEFISRATIQMALEAPTLFNEDETRWAVHKDRVPTLTTDLLKVSGTDAWVLETELAVGTTDALVWETDKLWWGRNILLKVPSSDPEEWHMARIREVWSEVVGGENKIRLSLDQPWQNATDTGIEYRVINNEFVLPDDVIEIRNISLMESSTGYPYPLDIIGQTPAEFATFPNQAALQAEGVPRAVYRRERQYIDGPKRAPGVEVTTDNDPWAGPDATGDFEYLITYVWGRQEIWTHSPGPRNMDDLLPLTPRYEPYWESAPSPISDQGTAPSSQAFALRLHLPNVDHMLGFDEATTARYRKAGIKKRIYRRRITADSPAAVAPSLLAYPHQDATNRFYMLDEVDGHITEYIDDGSVIPDLRRPFREVHGYQTFRLYPVPDNRYELVMRYIRHPLPLQDLSDVPQVPRDAVEAIVLKTLVYLYEMQGNAAMAARKQAEYTAAMNVLLKRYGDMRPPSRIRRRRVARVRDRSVWRRDLSGVVRNA